MKRRDRAGSGQPHRVEVRARFCGGPVPEGGGTAARLPAPCLCLQRAAPGRRPARTAGGAGSLGGGELPAPASLHPPPPSARHANPPCLGSPPASGQNHPPRPRILPRTQPSHGLQDAEPQRGPDRVAARYDRKPAAGGRARGALDDGLPRPPIPRLTRRGPIEGMSFRHACMRESDFRGAYAAAPLPTVRGGRFCGGRALPPSGKPRCRGRPRKQCPHAFGSPPKPACPRAPISRARDQDGGAAYEVSNPRPARVDLDQRKRFRACGRRAAGLVLTAGACSYIAARTRPRCVRRDGDGRAQALRGGHDGR